MKLLGIDIGYEEPFFYLGPWEFLVHDNGWTLLKRRRVKLDGSWPTYWTFRPWRSKRTNP